jgi:hypothetical protein
MSRAQKPSRIETIRPEMPQPMSLAEKEALIRSMIASMRLEGIEISRAVAERAIERALKRPVPEALD